MILSSAVWNKKNRTFISSVFLLGCLSFIYSNPAAATKHLTATHSATIKAEPVVLNFVNAELDAVIQIIAKLTNRNFLLDPKVKGTISLVSLKPVSSKSVYPLFLAALRQQGLAAIDLPGGVTKIVQESESRSQPVPLLKSGQSLSLNRSHLYTYIHPLEYESAAALTAALRPLMTANSIVSTVPSSNTLIVTDYAENIQKLQKIIESLDRPVGEPKIFRLKYTSAAEIANMLNKLLGEGTPATPNAAGGEPLKINIVPDPRTNTLLVRSDNLARKAQIQRWIDELDVPTSSPSNLHIVYLKNSEAARMAALLRNVLGLDSTPPDTTPTSLSSNNATSNSTPTTTLFPPNFQPNKAPTSNAANGSSTNTGLAVHADVINNALLILAPSQLFREIEQIIEQMDIRRAQVFVEALVVEMSAEKAAEFGIQWQTFGGINDAKNIRVIGGTNFNTGITGSNILAPTTNLSNIAAGLNFGIVKGTVSLPGLGQVLNLGLLARALESNANANILSTPTLMTLDNEEARIVIGQNVPFITGQYTQNNNSPFQTIERRDVGLTLKVKPQITQGGSVRLTLYQEVSSVQDKTISNNAGVITNKRSIESTVLVDDGQVIVLGGLMQDSMGDSVDKVPVAGDVPILGSLFRYNAKKRSKTNLMIFMRPTIVRTAHKTEALSVDRYRYLIDNAQAQTPNEPLPFPTELPSKDQPLSLKPETPKTIDSFPAAPSIQATQPLPPQTLDLTKKPAETSSLPKIELKSLAAPKKQEDEPEYIPFSLPSSEDTPSPLSAVHPSIIPLKTPVISSISKTVLKDMLPSTEMLPIGLPIEQKSKTTHSFYDVTLPKCRAC